MVKKFLLLLVVFLVVSSSASAESVRLGIAEFVSRTRVADKEVLQRVTEIFSEILSSSQNIEIASNKKLGTLKAVNAKSAAEAGKNAGCDYVLLGAVMDMSAKSDYTNPWTPVIEIETVLETRVIEAATAKVILSASGKGRVNFSVSPFNSNTMMKTIDGNKEKSFILAASMAAEKICSSLAGEYPEISSFRKSKAGKKSASGKILGTLRINRGTSAGIQEGAYYRIYLMAGKFLTSAGNH